MGHVVAMILVCVTVIFGLNLCAGSIYDAQVKRYSESMQEQRKTLVQQFDAYQQRREAERRAELIAAAGGGVPGALRADLDIQTTLDEVARRIFTCQGCSVRVTVDRFTEFVIVVQGSNAATVQDIAPAVKEMLKAGTRQPYAIWFKARQDSYLARDSVKTLRESRGLSESDIIAAFTPI